ncbi:peritrophin-48-like [Babylonia areolata]|uniref:peritrophin-48-like n=1 Tax=Babylonia areolata TaxID=304850 RepID=UPI003FD1881C
MNSLVWFVACLPVLVQGTETWDPHYISCDGFPDGYHEVGCWGKAVCVNGEAVITKCNDDQMFDFNTDTCVSRSQQIGSTSCNTALDCSKESTGRHADIGDGCKSYHICLEGSYYGRFYCPPRTIFNEALQVCDYPGDAPAPCGPHKLDYSSTPQGPWPEYTVIG